MRVAERSNQRVAGGGTEAARATARGVTRWEVRLPGGVRARFVWGLLQQVVDRMP
ncbi:hypothetical protein [Geodermatophilus sp. TF02-6]|uniref:hypothetical protein n=1 Tax=Geodermatophilus sp. TF02-6 TaxID=2250575 RepID=UPI001314F0FE|nr:hypothetical protein [Geodermatophilus sp. TF02-6]